MIAGAESSVEIPYRLVPLAALHVSPLNPRKHFDPARLQELAASMADGVGIIEPIVARPHTRLVGELEIVAGARRHMAAALAGLAHAPVVVKHLTDDQVLELMVIENDQREGISPLEEAQGFTALIGFGRTVDDLAQRIGRPRRYVWDRLKLLELIPAAQTLLVQHRITVGHAAVIARCAPELQQQIVDVEDGAGCEALFEHESLLLTPAEHDADVDDPYHGLKARTVAELEGWVAEHERLALASETTAELFPEAVQRLDQATKVVHITHNHQVHPDAKAGGGQRIYSTVSWKRADGEEDSKACDQAVLGVIVVGPGRGQAFPVCIAKDACARHWGAEKRLREKQKTARASSGGPKPAAVDYVTQQRQRRQAQAKQAVERQLMEAATGRAATQLATATKVLTADLQRLALDYLIDGEFPSRAFGEAFKVKGLGQWNYQNTSKLRAAVKAMDAATVTQALAWIILAVRAEQENDHKSRAALFAPYKIDYAAIVAELRPALQRGTCQHCGCTEKDACVPPCTWMEDGETVCSSPACVRAAAKAARANTPAKAAKRATASGRGRAGAATKAPTPKAGKRR